VGVEDKINLRKIGFCSSGHLLYWRVEPWVYYVILKVPIKRGYFIMYVMMLSAGGATVSKGFGYSQSFYLG
jgi:hypothetical protein